MLKALSVTLFTGRSTDFEQITPNSGVRVFVNNQYTLSSQAESVDVTTGTETNIAVKKRIIEIKDYPYSDCVTKNNEKIDGNVFDDKYFLIFKRSNLKYRSSDCLTYCYQKEIYRKCGCIDFYGTFNNIENLTLDYCVSSNPECLSNIKASGIDLCIGKCPRECDYIKFDLTTSFSNYPSKSEYNNIVNNTPLNNGSFTYINNFVKVNVFYADTQYELITESPAISAVNLLSDLGGTLGLFLGFSMLSFIEVIEFFINCIREFYWWRRKNRVVQES